LDGSTLDVADEEVNEEAFGRPGASRGTSAYPQIRFVSLVENGTHVLFASQMADYGTGEITLAKAVLAGLRKGMLCLADRQFFGFALWNQARATGADLLWRIKKNLRLACEKRLPDGSYLSRIYASERDWRHKANGVRVRVIDYMAHFAVRGLMHEAALQADEDPGSRFSTPCALSAASFPRSMLFPLSIGKRFIRRYWTNSSKNASYRAATAGTRAA